MKKRRMKELVRWLSDHLRKDTEQVAIVHDVPLRNKVYVNFKDGVQMKIEYSFVTKVDDEG